MKMSIGLFGHFYRKCLILIYWSSLLLYYHKHIFQAVWHSINTYCLNKNTHIHNMNMSRYNCHILKSCFVSKTGIFALDSSLVRMKPSRWFLPHTDCDASVTTLMHLSTACVWHGYLSNVTTGEVGSRRPINFRRSSSLILIVMGGSSSSRSLRYIYLTLTAQFCQS